MHINLYLSGEHDGIIWSGSVLGGLQKGKRGQEWQRVNNIETNASVYEGSIIKCIVHYCIIGSRAIEKKKVIKGVNLN
jgi:hypothetical protein